MRFRERALKSGVLVPCSPKPHVLKLKEKSFADLAWIDLFFNNVKDFLFLREEDSVLILPPNRVYKLNCTGIQVLKHLYSGRSILSLPGLLPGERSTDVNMFFSNLKAIYEGSIVNMDEAGAMELIPFDFSYTRLPILGEIAVTYRCNNRCLFCYAHCDNRQRTGDKKRNGEELPTRRLKRIIRIFKEKAKIPFFSFTGGEPLLRKDLEKLILYAVRLKLKVNLISNGILATPSRSESLYRSGLKTAQISVEGSNAKTHDGLTGVPGSFDKTLSGIRNLQKAGISVQTNTTLSGMNVESAGEMPEFLKGIGIDRFAMNLFIPSGRGLDHEELFLPYSNIAPVIETVRREACRLGMTFYWYSPIPHCHYNPIARGLGNKSCAAMDGLLSVSPNGDVLPCSSYPEVIGNLFDRSFSDIWFSNRALYFKEKRYAPSECKGCEQFTACQGACPLYWSYAGTGEIRKI
jgi:radical SAM protein with 4Fe4S-binding SPASM domain